MGAPIETLQGLLGFRSLEKTPPPLGFWSEAGGGVAYEGALRLFPWSQGSDWYSFAEWNSPEGGWRSQYGALAPPWNSFAEDAFGVQYLISPGSAREVAVFWSETGEVERLGVGLVEFFRMISDDPENTISFGFYRSCIEMYGELSLRKHFAMRVETALGGQLMVDNVAPMDAMDHMRALGHIARRIASVEIGTPMKPPPRG